MTAPLLPARESSIARSLYLSSMLSRILVKRLLPCGGRVVCALMTSVASPIRVAGRR
jgi:hypothetical protein